jgi:hypothetical protein
MSWRSSLASLLALILGCSFALAQTPSRVFRVGLLSVGANSSGICGPLMVKHFVERGYQPGVNLEFEIRAAQGKLETLSQYA